MMDRKQFVSICASLICLVLLAISAGCALSQSEGSPFSKIFAPAYTPIVMVPEGTKLPTRAKLVSLEQLTEHPQQYANQFIEVHGFNEGGFAIPASWPYYGPIDNWGLAASLTIYHGYVADSYPPMIEVNNRFKDVMMDWWGPIYNTAEKKVAVWGWWRLYDGPIGCGQTPQGTPIPPTPDPNQQNWYLDAVKLQWLESIEVSTPKNK